MLTGSSIAMMAMICADPSSYPHGQVSRIMMWRNLNTDIFVTVTAFTIMMTSPRRHRRDHSGCTGMEPQTMFGPGLPSRSDSHNTYLVAKPEQSTHCLKVFAP
jgi:hypothetical protein